MTTASALPWERQKSPQRAYFPTTSASFIPLSSASSAATNDSILLLHDLQRAHEHFLNYAGQRKLHDTSPPYDNAEEQRVQMLARSITSAMIKTPHMVPSMLNLRCIKHPAISATPYSRKSEPKGRVLRVLPLADDDAQWDRFINETERPPRLMRRKEAAKQLQSIGLRIPIMKESQPVPSAIRTDNIVLSSPTPPHILPTTSNLDAPAPPAKNDLTLPAQMDLFPPSAVSTQDITIPFHPIPLGQPELMRFPVDTELSLSFDPPLTSTPPKRCVLSAVVNHSFSTTPVRTKAEEYLEETSMPARLFVATPRPDLKRVPTFEDLRRAESAKKRALNDAKRRSKFSTLAASQASSVSAADEPLSAPSTPERNAKAAISLSTPPPSTDRIRRKAPASPRTFSEEENPTPSPTKQGFFGNLFGLGSLGAFSSQFDVESKVDDISKFMEEDDIFM